jgi:hypothetical protein
MTDVSVDDIKARFEHEIELRAYDDKYIDRNEEREILEIAIQLGMGTDRARAALAEVCAVKGYVMESVVLKSIREQLEVAIANDGKVDSQEFDTVFRHAKEAMAGKKTDREIKKMIVLLMEDTGHNRVKTGWFKDWYAALKKELGMK